MGIQVVLADTLTPHHQHRHRHHPHHVLAELCGRPADQHQNDQERRDRWPRWKYLGPQCRVSGSAEELKTLLTRYANTDELAMNGVMIAGTKYMFLSATDRVVRGKKGTSGVHCIKTVQALIVCVYEDPVVPEQAATVTEKLGEYLISVGY